jgi:hypothetical protein
VGTTENRRCRQRDLNHNEIARGNDHYGIGNWRFVNANISKARQLTGGENASVDSYPATLLRRGESIKIPSKVGRSGRSGRVRGNLNQGWAAARHPAPQRGVAQGP